MTDREKYEKLDDIGFVGMQEKLSPRYKKFLEKKTGEIIRKMKEANKKPSSSKSSSNV